MFSKGKPLREKLSLSRQMLNRMSKKLVEYRGDFYDGS